MPTLLGRLFKGTSGPAIHGNDGLAEARAAFLGAARQLSLIPEIIPPRLRDDIAVLHGFCRLVDTIVDEPSPGVDPRPALEDLEQELSGTRPARPLVALLRASLPRLGIDPALFGPFVEGMQADLGVVRLEDDEALIRYAYRVAGTVSVMTCAALGTRPPRAVPFAVDLGIGLQITNIVRDWSEDASRGRVYLPASRLRSAGLSPDDVLRGHAGAALRPVLEGLNRLADRYYQSAESAAGDIPLRYRHGVLVMDRVYRSEGRRAARGARGSRPGGLSVPGWERALRIGEVAVLALHPRVMGLIPPPPHDRSLHQAILGLPGCDA